MELLKPCRGVFNFLTISWAEHDLIKFRYHRDESRTHTFWGTNRDDPVSFAGCWLRRWKRRLSKFTICSCKGVVERFDAEAVRICSNITETVPHPGWVEHIAAVIPIYWAAVDGLLWSIASVPRPPARLLLWALANLLITSRKPWCSCTLVGGLVQYLLWVVFVRRAL